MEVSDEVIGSIRAILLRDWDPNAIGENENLADEYDQFLPEIALVVSSGASSSDIEEALLRAESVMESYVEKSARSAAAVALAAFARSSRK